MKLDPKEYDFKTVPPEELYPCCLWEYARESATVLNLLGKLDPKKPVTKLEDPLCKIMSHALIIGVAFESATKVIKPWLALPRKTRKGFTRNWPVSKSRMSYKKSITLAPTDPRTSYFFDSGDVLDDLLNFASPYRDYLDLRQESSVDFKLERNFEGALETGIFYIQWDRNNDEIVASFKVWLKKNRPEGIAQRDRRGHNLNHYRVALRRLGTMRRLHADPGQTNSEWNKEARRALKHFYEFVRGIRGEKPIHWPGFLGTE